MRTALRLGLIGAAAAVGVLSAGAALAAGAEKEVVFKQAHGLCDVGATSGAETTSFAIIRFPSNNTVSTTIKVNKLDPDTTYQVRLVQTRKRREVGVTELVDALRCTEVLEPVLAEVAESLGAQ